MFTIKDFLEISHGDIFLNIHRHKFENPVINGTVEWIRGEIGDDIEQAQVYEIYENGKHELMLIIEPEIW